MAKELSVEEAVARAQRVQDERINAIRSLAETRQRLTDVAKFCLDVNGTNVFLVEGTHLQEDEWGKEIQALADLRLLHQIGNLSVQTGSYRGRRFVGFTLDLSNWTGTRSERIAQIEFWTPSGRQDARRARLIYTPGAADRPASITEPAQPKAKVDDEELTGDWVQTDIFSLLSPPTEASDRRPVEIVDPIEENEPARN